MKNLIRADMPTRKEVCDTHGEYESKNYLANIWSRCPACSEDEARGEAERKAAQERQNKAQAWQNRLGYSGIPDRFKNRTLAGFEASTAHQKTALEFAMDYADNFDSVIQTGRSAMFLGKPGTGKTHLACGIGLQIMAQGRTVLFTTVMRAVRRVKDSWSRSDETETQAIAAMTFPDLLILDEVGVQFGSEFERNIMFDVINERYERRKPTLFLSNLNRNEIERFLGERVIDRMREDGGKVIVFDWESHRRK